VERKTIRLNPNEYTSFSEDFDKHDLIILAGARGAGKSYPAAKYIKSWLIKNPDGKFAYVRGAREELPTYRSWFDDLDLEDLIPKSVVIEDGWGIELVRGKPGRGDITLMVVNEQQKVVWQRTIAKLMSLGNSWEYKSGKYDEFGIVIFEEYVRGFSTISQEEKISFNFIELVETIFRNRDKKIFLIGNSLKTLPILDGMIDELTGRAFVNPVKISIFRQSGAKGKLAKYLDGEFSREKFDPEVYHQIINVGQYLIFKHRIFSHEYYIALNKAHKVTHVREEEARGVMDLCRQGNLAKFNFPNGKVERDFSNDWNNIRKLLSKTIFEAQRWRPSA
jgi:hypothetical protein